MRCADAFFQVQALDSFNSLFLKMDELKMGVLNRSVADKVQHILLDLDIKPFIPENWRGIAKDGHRKMGKCVELERREDDLYLNGKKIVFHLSKRQKNGKVIHGFKFREEFSSQEVLNANVLDYLLAHPELIPDSWKFDENGNTRFIYFWGTIYLGSDGYPCVRFLCWSVGGWRWGCRWLDDDWSSGEPAAVLASQLSYLGLRFLALAL